MKKARADEAGKVLALKNTFRVRLEQENSG